MAQTTARTTKKTAKKATNKRATTKGAKKAASRSTQKRTGASGSFTAEERDAMRERAKELKAEAAKADGEKALLAKVAEMKGTDRAMAERLHAIVMEAAPSLAPKTWYGMPAWAKDGKILCFFQSAAKFDARYATFGFNDGARLDQGTMWPTSWALTDLTPADEKKIAALVKKAAR
ncbi:MAG TPA: DUF1801 domain-containing protein [Actinomycetes bacterium]|nr:DUF1801 domain-containing protein [Actinomycetes bacterium]